MSQPKQTHAASPNTHAEFMLSGSAHPHSSGYSHFTFSAVVDWIELKIVTETPTNFPTVRRRMDLPHVKAVNAGEGGAATCFLFKIHDPKSWAEIDAAIARLTVDHPLAEPVPSVAKLRDTWFIKSFVAAFVSYLMAWLFKEQISEIAIQPTD